MENSTGKKAVIDYHISRILVYLALYGGAVFLYAVLRSYMFLLLVLLMAILPIVSAVMTVRGAGRYQAGLAVSSSCAVRGEEIQAGILLSHPFWSISPEVKFTVCGRNLYYETEKVFTASVSAYIKKQSSMTLPLVLERNGLVELTLTKMKISDWMGMFAVQIPLREVVQVTVLPPRIQFTEEEKVGFYAGVTDTEENMHKGNDLADTGNIRDYVPGDRIKDIHWKLSAKKQTLLVKERVRMSERQIVVLLETEGSNDRIDEILQLGYSLIQMFTESGVLVKLLWWSRQEHFYREAIMTKTTETEDAFRQMYDSGMNRQPEGSKYPVLQNGTCIQSYVRIGLCDGVAGAENV